MNALPDPLVPKWCHLRTRFLVPLPGSYLLRGGLWDRLSFKNQRYLTRLWSAAWYEQPAASLPNDDRVLASLAGCPRGLKQWLELRDLLLEGWILCSDGRLYQPDQAQEALKQWEQEQNERAWIQKLDLNNNKIHSHRRRKNDLA